MGQDRKVFRPRETRQKSDLTARRHALRGSNRIRVFEDDALLGDESLQPFGELLRITQDGGELRQRVAFGLAHIENIRCSKPEESRVRVLVEFIARLLLTDHGSQNDDALFTLADIAPEFQPSVEPCNLSRVRPLAIDQEAVAPRVAVKPGHHGEIVLEGIALAPFEGLHKPGDGVITELFGLFGSHSRDPRCGGSPSQAR